MRILVVDDEPIIRNLLTATLEPLGFELSEAANGLEAIAQMEKIHPEIILLDVTMPGVNGFEVLERLRLTEGSPRAFVLMLTGLGEIKDLEKGLAAGADDYLVKPFQLRELIARIQAAVRVQTLQVELLRKNEELEKVNRALASSLRVQEMLNHKMMIEMEVAARLQNGFMSPCDFKFGSVRASARYQPSTKIGGDFYDLRLLGNAKAGIFLADAVGHGVSAALMAAMMKTALEDALAIETQPSRVLGALNRSFHFCSAQGKYLTAFFGLLDCNSGDLVYSLAGHVPPMLYCRATGRIELLDSPGHCLGIFGEGGYEDRQAQLCPGDRLFAYTDGISEASPDDGQLYGWRFSDFLTQSGALNNEDFLNRLNSGLIEFLGGSQPADDYTLLSIQRISNQAGIAPALQ
jgi:phosphoserine phosphatase RsbU/P